MGNGLATETSAIDFDLDYVEGTRTRSTIRGRQLLAGGILALVAATSTGTPAGRGSNLREMDEYVLSYQPGTGTSTGIRTLLSIDLTAAESLFTTESVLAQLRSVLGLNIAETARVVGVERPTIYAWLAQRSVPQRANSVRLARLEGVVAMWRRLADRTPGPLVRTPGSDGQSLVDLLAVDPMPEGLIKSRMQEILRADATPRRQSVRDIAERHGIGVARNPELQREIDWLTRRPFGAEDS